MRCTALLASSAAQRFSAVVTYCVRHSHCSRTVIGSVGPGWLADAVAHTCARLHCSMSACERYSAAVVCLCCSATALQFVCLCCSAHLLTSAWKFSSKSTTDGTPRSAAQCSAEIPFRASDALTHADNDSRISTACKRPGRTHASKQTNKATKQAKERAGLHRLSLAHGRSGLAVGSECCAPARCRWSPRSAAASALSGPPRSSGSPEQRCQSTP